MNREEHAYIRGGLTKEFIKLFDNMKSKHCNRWYKKGNRELYNAAVSTFNLRVCEHYYKVVNDITVKGEIVHESQFAAYLDVSLRSITEDIRQLTGQYDLERTTDALAWRDDISDIVDSEGEVFTQEERISLNYYGSFEGGIEVDVEYALSTIKNPKTRFAAKRIYLDGWDTVQFYLIYQDWLGITRNAFTKNIQRINLEEMEKYKARQIRNQRNRRRRNREKRKLNSNE